MTTETQLSEIINLLKEISEKLESINSHVENLDRMYVAPS